MPTSDNEPAGTRTAAASGVTTPERSAERIVQANGVDLCVQTFGDPADPAVLLVGGNGGSMLWWEEEFCERLAAGARFVVRYDHRDTGRSVNYPPGSPPYGLHDLVADAAGILDTLGLDRAHLVGISMGGAICQLLALDFPQRVASLTVVASSPAGPGAADLPGIGAEFLAFLTSTPAPDWSDHGAVVAYGVEFSRACAGRGHPFDEESVRQLWQRDLDRTRDVAAAMTNHSSLRGGGEPWRERLGEIGVPTLVVHGTDDPVFPLAHGEAMAAEVRGAELLTLGGTGHELPRPVWDEVVPAILRHTAAG